MHSGDITTVMYCLSLSVTAVKGCLKVTKADLYETSLYSIPDCPLQRLLHDVKTENKKPCLSGLLNLIEYNCHNIVQFTTSKTITNCAIITKIWEKQSVSLCNYTDGYYQADITTGYYT